MFNTIKKGFLLVIMLLSVSVVAQNYDDLYYPHGEQEMWADASGDTHITNNNYYGDVEYDDDDYEYYYSSRIRRFHQPSHAWNNYYSDFYIDRYHYNYNDPWHWGSSIYYTPNYAYRLRNSGYMSSWVFTTGFNSFGGSRYVHDYWNHYPYNGGYGSFNTCAGNFYSGCNSYYGWNNSPYGGGYYGGYGVSSYNNGYYNGYSDAYCDYSANGQSSNYSGPSYPNRGNGIDSYSNNNFGYSDSGYIQNVTPGQVNYTVDNITNTSTVSQSSVGKSKVNSVSNNNNSIYVKNPRTNNSKVTQTKPRSGSTTGTVSTRPQNTNTRPNSTVTTKPNTRPQTTRPSNERPKSTVTTRPSTRPQNTNTRPSARPNTSNKGTSAPKTSKNKSFFEKTMDKVRGNSNSSSKSNRSYDNRSKTSPSRSSGSSMRSKSSSSKSRSSAPSKRSSSSSKTNRNR